MPQPVVSALAQRMYDYLEPYHISQGVSDEQLGWPLLRWCTGWAGLIQDVYDVVKTRNGKEGWSALTDPDQAIELTMPFLAQLIGLRLTQGESVEEWRNTIKDAAGLYAATPRAVAGELQKLAPTDVLILEKSGSAYQFVVGFTVTDYHNILNADSSTFEGGLGNWGQQFGAIPVQSTEQAHGGTHSLKLTTANAADLAACHPPSQSVAAGRIVRAQYWVRANSAATIYTMLALGLADEQISELSTPIPANEWTLIRHSITADITRPGPNLYIGTDTFPETIYVDDVNIYFDDVYLREAREAVARQKFLGGKFTVIDVQPIDWNYFVLSATVYRRQPSGYIEEIPPPYTNYADLEASFATYADLEANNPS